MDSDSVLPDSFLKDIVLVAEHPDHAKVAIFQSKPIIWNKNNLFLQTMTYMNRALFYPVKKLANRCYQMLSWGHNDLIRTEAILANGGYNEKYISEDFATTMDLMRAGYNCTFVDIETYEGMPADFIGLTKRCVRWAKSTLEIFVYYRKTKISFMTKIILLLNTHAFLMWFLYIPGMIMAIWIFQSSIHDAFYLMKNSGYYNYQALIILFLNFFYIVTFLFIKYPYAHIHKVSLIHYFKNLLLNISLSFYLAIPVVIGQLQVIFKRQIHFEVSHKRWRNVKLFYILYQSRYMFLVSLIILVGLIEANPLGLIYNIFWMIPIFSFPFVIYYFHIKSRRGGYNENDDK